MKDKNKKLIVGNWKMNPSTIKEALAVYLNIKGVAGKLRNVQTVICPPFVQISELIKKTSGHRVVIGAQNVSNDKEGAHTGDISAGQLNNIGVNYTIVGHSERRAKGETDIEVAEKIKLLLKNNITPIVCIGEKERDEVGNYSQYLKNQLIASLKDVSKKGVESIVIAYEPIWAIGKDAQREALAEDVLEITIFIRKVMTDTFGKKIGENLTILFGGSVNPANTEDILMRGGVQGLLVGRASLNPTAFNSIISTANQI